MNILFEKLKYLYFLFKLKLIYIVGKGTNDYSG
jgi:hypothetical protein